MNNKLFIVIVNYNSGKDINDCVKSLFNQDCSFKLKIVIVDNKSSDNSIKILKNKFFNIEVIQKDTNIGFARACNIGIKYCLNRGADYVYIINPDTISKLGSISALINVIRNDKNVGISSPVLKNYKSNYDIGAKFNQIFGRTKHTHVSKLPCNIIYAELVSGCAMMIRKEVFKKIGYFDEKFFLYFEDSDFCLRARKAGFKIAITPKAIIYHKISNSIGTDSWKKNCFIIKGNFLFINKHVKPFFLPVAYSYLILLFLKMLINKLV